MESGCRIAAHSSTQALSRSFAERINIDIVVQGAVGLVARGAHVPLGSDTQLRGATGSVEAEIHSLSLSQHPKDGPFECMGGEFVLGEIGVAQYDAVTGGRIERLDDALHTTKRYHR